MRNCLREMYTSRGYVRPGSGNSFCLKFWLARYRGATPRIQSVTRRELSASGCELLYCVIRHAGALVQMRREGEILRAFVRIENRCCPKNLSRREREPENENEKKRKREEGVLAQSVGFLGRGSIDPRASTYEIACWRRRGSTDCIQRYCDCWICVLGRG